MSKGILAAGVIMLGILTLALVNIIQNYSSGNELDYSLLKDTTEAAMLDAVDLGYYQLSGGQVRIDKEKFVENFIRRFAQNVNQDRDYNIRFFDINETPPKVSIRIGSTTSATFNAESWGIKNQIDAILETKYQERRNVDQAIKELYNNANGGGSSSGSDSGRVNGAGLDKDGLPSKTLITKMLKENWRDYYDCEEDPKNHRYDICTRMDFEDIVWYAQSDYESLYDLNFNGFESAYFEDVCASYYPKMKRTRRVKG